ASVVAIQSPVRQITFENFTFGASLAGTGTNTTINGGTVPAIAVGPTFYGHGNSIVANGARISASQRSVHYLPATSYSFNSGTFTVARADPLFANAIALGVPGFTYYLGCTDGTVAAPV